MEIIRNKEYMRFVYYRMSTVQKNGQSGNACAREIRIFNFVDDEAPKVYDDGTTAWLKTDKMGDVDKTPTLLADTLIWRTYTDDEVKNMVTREYIKQLGSARALRRKLKSKKHGDELVRAMEGTREMLLKIPIIDIIARDMGPEAFPWTETHQLDIGDVFSRLYDSRDGSTELIHGVVNKQLHVDNRSGGIYQVSMSEPVMWYSQQGWQEGQEIYVSDKEIWIASKAKQE